MRLELPPPYVARPYRGAQDHPAMAAVLNGYHGLVGDPELVTAAQLAATYGNLSNCDPDRDVAVIADGDQTPVGYVRAAWEDHPDGSWDCVAFFPISQCEDREAVYRAVLAGVETHMRPWSLATASTRYKTHAPHPGPEVSATGEAAWLESAGYQAIRFGALLVRPDLDDLPEPHLPDGVEVRAVSEDQLRQIFDAEVDAFRGSWDFQEPTDQTFQEFLDDPLRDLSLWRVAWHADTVVGQVKTFVNHEENAERGYLRGYTEDIATHPHWRNCGIAKALLTASLHELRDRGYEQAALGVDTANPGGAFQLYTSLGFQLARYQAVYAKSM